jgi:hypothetical protein
MDDANVAIADLQDPAGAAQRARERELAAAIQGQTIETAEELQRLYESLWQLEDAATAAAEAAEAMAAAQQMMDDANVRIADLMDPAGATQRAREREIAEAIQGQTPETAAELQRLYETLYGLEDAATAAAEAADAAAKAADALARAQEITADLTGRIADLQDPAGAIQRARELDLTAAIQDQTAATAAELTGLYQTLWGLEDAATAAAAAAELLEKATAAQEEMAIRIADLQDEAGAQQRARERELAAVQAGQAAETADALRVMAETLWGLEDAALAAAEAAAALEERVGLNMRLLELVGTSAEIQAAQREIEKAGIADSNHALLELIWLIEDTAAAMEAAINSEYDSKIAGITAQEEAANAANAAAERAAAEENRSRQESLNALQGVVSIIQSALSGMRGEKEFSADRFSGASAQLSSWAASAQQSPRWATLPEAAALDRVLATLGQGTEAEFATEAQWRAAQATTFAALLALESAGLQQVSHDEKILAAMQGDSAAASSWHDAEMAAYEQAREQAATWRDDQLAAMASQLRALTELPAAMGDVIAASPVPTVTINEDGLVQFTTPSAANTEQTEALQAIKEELALLRKDMAVIGNAQLAPVQSIESTLTRWNLDGLPATSDDESGATITLLQVA